MIRTIKPENGQIFIFSVPKVTNMKKECSLVKPCFQRLIKRFLDFKAIFNVNLIICSSISCDVKI